MPSQEEIASQQELLATYRRTLAHLLQQAAQYGGAAFTPPQTANGIHEARTNIQHIKQMLRGWGATIVDHPDDAEKVEISHDTTLFVPDIGYHSASQDHVYALPIDAQDLETDLDDYTLHWAVSSDGMLTIDGEEFKLDTGRAHFSASFLLMSASTIVIRRVKLIISHQEPAPSLEHFRLIGDIRYRDAGAGPVPGLSFYEFEARPGQTTYELRADDRYDDTSRLPYQLNANESVNMSIPYIIFSYDGILTLHCVIETFDYLGQAHEVTTSAMYFKHVHAPVQALQKIPAALRKV